MQTERELSVKEKLAKVFEDDLRSQRYALKENNLYYRMQQRSIPCNSFVVRPLCDVVNFDNRRLLIAYRMASVISHQLDEGKGMQADEEKDFQPGIGYAKD